MEASLDRGFCRALRNERACCTVRLWKEHSKKGISMCKGTEVRNKGCCKKIFTYAAAAEKILWVAAKAKAEEGCFKNDTTTLQDTSFASGARGSCGGL